MEDNEQLVRDTLEARYFDLRNIIAGKMKHSPDDEEVDEVATQTVCKCLRAAKKYDAAKMPVWGWVLQNAWNRLQLFYRTKTTIRGKVYEVRTDAMNHVKSGFSGEGEEQGVESLPERPGWPVGAEEDCIITAIDIKRGWVPNGETK